MSKDLTGIPVWKSGFAPPDKAMVLNVADLQRGFDAIRDAGRRSFVLTMGPRTYDAFRDWEHTEAVRTFLGIVGPFEPITVKSVRRSITRKWGTFTYRLRKAIRVMRYGYDPEDM